MAEEQTPNTPQTPIEHTVENSMTPEKKVNWMKIVIGIFFGAILLIIGALLGRGQLTQDKPIPLEQGVIPTSAPQPTQEIIKQPTEAAIQPTTSLPLPISTLPEGWTSKENGNCGVKFSIPPKEAPYYDSESGRFWDFPRGAISPNMLLKLPGGTNYDQVNAMYTSPEEATGYIASVVSVSCLPNMGIANNDALLSSLEAGIQTYNQNSNSESMEASSYEIVHTKEMQKWNNKVLQITVKEEYSASQFTENFYVIFVSPRYIYEVRTFGNLDDQMVQQGALTIMDFLTFE